MAVMSILIVIIAAPIPFASAMTVEPACPAQIRWGPVLTNMTTDSVTVSWWTDQTCRGVVGYEELLNHVPGTFSLTSSEAEFSGLHRIRLENLTPNQTYVYSVSGSSEEYSFRTFPIDGPIRFVVYGDTREQLPQWNQSTHHALVAGRIAAEPDILFVVHTGDLVNDPQDTGEWDRFFAAAEPILSHVPFYPVAGNHEQDSGIIQELFGMPLWYDIRCSDVRVVVLDSNPLPPDQAAEQDRFIAGNPDCDANWTFVALHHPLYSADPSHPGGFLDVRERWEPVFISWNVSAVFAAHVHAYEHIERNGIHYFTVATGGAPSYSLSPEKPEGYVTGLENTLGYAVVTVNPATWSAMMEFVEVADTQGTSIRVYPSGTIYERVNLDDRFHTEPSWGASRFPILFTSHFGDLKIKMLS
jgi:hypothetical protein